MIFWFLLFTSQSFAADTSMSAAALQARHGTTCLDVSNKDVISYRDQQCTGRTESRVLLQSDSKNIYNRLVHEDAAKIQVIKNNCTIEQINNFKADKNLFQTWYANLAASWMSYKKTELVLEQCDVHVRDLDPAEVKRVGFQKAYAEYRKGWLPTQAKLYPPISTELSEVCTNPQLRASFEAAKEVMQQTLPFVTDPKFFEMMEANRDAIKSQKTDKPLTDQEILASDFSDIGKAIWIEPPTPEFEKQVLKRADDFVKQRTKMNAAIESAQKRKEKQGGFHLPEGVTKAMYEDGTLQHVLKKNKQIPEDYTNLENAHRGTVTPGAVCLLSYHEHSFIGSLGDFWFASVTGGAALKSLGAGAKWIGNYVRRKSAYGAGVATVGVPTSLGDLYDICVKQKNIVSRERESFSSIRNKVRDLPRTVGFHAQQYIEFDSAKTPSCQKLMNQDIVFFSPDLSHCYTAIAEGASPLPLKVIIPMTILREN